MLFQNKQWQFPSMSQGLLFAAMFFATLWDFRYGSYRFFDFVSFLALGGFLLINRKSIQIKELPSKELFFCGVVIAWASYGFMQFEHRSSLAIIVGMVVFFCARQVLNEHQKWLRYCAALILAFHVFFLLLQMTLYYSADIIFNPFVILGYENRVINEMALLPVMRPAGLFAEPNSYCVTIMMLLALLFKEAQPYKYLSLFAIFTLCLSQSLWGVLLVIPFVVFWSISNYTNIKQVVFSSGLALLMLYGLFFASLYIAEGSARERPHFVKRITSIAGDVSLKERFQGNTSLSSHSEKKKKDIIDEAGVESDFMSESIKPLDGIEYLLFGRGLSTKPFLYGVPLNGFSLLYYSFGIVGLLLLAYSGCRVFIPTYSRRVTKEYYIWGGVVLIILSSYPLFTYMFFWLWLSSTMPFLGDVRIFTQFSLQKKK